MQKALRQSSSPYINMHFKCLRQHMESLTLFFRKHLYSSAKLHTATTWHLSLSNFPFYSNGCNQSNEVSTKTQIVVSDSSTPSRYRVNYRLRLGFYAFFFSFFTLKKTTSNSGKYIYFYLMQNVYNKAGSFLNCKRANSSLSENSIAWTSWSVNVAVFFFFKFNWKTFLLRMN